HHEALDEGPGRRTDAVDPEGSGRPDRRGAFEVHRPQRKHDQGEALPGPPKAGKSSRQARQALYFVIWYTRSGRRSAKTGMQGSGESGRFTGPSEMREEVMHSLLSEHLEGYLSGNLGQADQQALDAHLAVCTECRGKLAGFQESAEYIRALRPPQDVEL